MANHTCGGCRFFAGAVVWGEPESTEMFVSLEKYHMAMSGYGLVGARYELTRDMAAPDKEHRWKFHQAREELVGDGNVVRVTKIWVRPLPPREGRCVVNPPRPLLSRTYKGGADALISADPETVPHRVACRFWEAREDPEW